MAIIYDWKTGTTSVSSAQNLIINTLPIGLNNVTCSVTDGITSATSNTAIVEVDWTYSKLKQGSDVVNYMPLHGYTIESTMAMNRSVDSRGIVSWLDDGRQFDTYSSEYTAEVQSSECQLLEQILCRDTQTDLTIDAPWERGFHPFGFEFAHGIDYAINVKSFDLSGGVNILEKARVYKFGIYPAVSFVTYQVSQVISSQCAPLDQWRIESIPFPFPTRKNELNNTKEAMITGGRSYSATNTTRQYGDIAEVAIKCGEEQARQIVTFFNSTMRGTTKTATFPAGYNIFGRRTSGLTSCKVKLFSPTIKQNHVNLGIVEITFTLQMVGV